MVSVACVAIVWRTAFGGFLLQLGTAYESRLARVPSTDEVNSTLLLQGLNVREQNGQLLVESIDATSPLAKQGLLCIDASLGRLIGSGIRCKLEVDVPGG